MKTCTKCKATKELTEFVKDARRAFGVSTYCKVCSYAQIKRWRLANPEKTAANARRYAARHPDRHLKTKFGIGGGEKARMLEAQGRVCGACGTGDHGSHKHKGKQGSESGWCLDHDHKTGKIRGVLCWKCNVTIGHAHESSERLRKLADYLDRHNAALNTLNAGVGRTLEGGREATSGSRAA